MILCWLRRSVAVLLLTPALSACQHVPHVIDSALIANSLDPGIFFGQLDNGFRYYLRSTNSAERDDQIEVRLVVRVGSIHEGPDQAGYSHLLEHVVYRGTEKYSAQKLEKLMDAHGLVWGRDVNATTHHGATVYRFSLSGNEKVLLPEILALYADFISGVIVESDALEAEKKVVQAEWMHRYGHKTFVVDPVTAIAFSGTAYDDRPPVGRISSIENATVDSLTSYWLNRYTPTNAALIVTGSIVPWELEASVKETFSPLSAKQVALTTQRNRLPVFDANPGQARYVSYIEPDSEVAEVAVTFISGVSNTPSENWQSKQFIDKLAFKTVSRMMARYMPLSCGAPVLGYSLLDSGQSVFRISSTATQSRFVACLGALEKALKQVGSYSIHPAEYNLLQAKFRQLAMEEGEVYRAGDAVTLADRITQRFIMGTPVLPAALYESVLLESIDRFGAVQFNRFLATLGQGYKIVHSVVGTAAEHLPPVDYLEREIRAGHQQIPARATRKSVAPAPHEPGGAAGKIFNQTVRTLIAEDRERIEWRLRNGAHAMFIKDYRYDSVAVAMIASGGFVSTGSELAAAAAVLPVAVASGDIGFASSDLIRSQAVESTVVVNPTSHGILAYATSDSLDALIARVSGHFEEPLIPGHLKRHFTAGRAYSNVHAEYFQIPRAGPVSLEQIRDAYNRLFLSPAEFTTVIVGNASKAQIEAVLDKIDYSVLSKDNPGAGGEFEQVVAAQDSAQYSDYNRVEVNWIHRCSVLDVAVAEPYMRLLSHVLQRRLRHQLREARGMSYSPEVVLLSDFANDAGRLNQISYVVKYADLARAHQLVESVLNSLGSTGITLREFNIALMRERKQRNDLSHDYVSFAFEQALIRHHGGDGLLSLGNLTLQGANQIAACFSAANASIFVEGQVAGERGIVSSRD